MTIYYIKLYAKLKHSSTASKQIGGRYFFFFIVVVNTCDEKLTGKHEKNNDNNHMLFEYNCGPSLIKSSTFVRIL